MAAVSGFVAVVVSCRAGRTFHKVAKCRVVLQAADAAPAGAAAAGCDDKSAWEDFASWLTKCGGDVGAVTMASPNGIRGLVAQRQIEKGETLLAVPLRVAIELADQTTEADPSAAALTLLQTYGGEAETMRPYLELIPRLGSPDLATVPDFFNAEELEMLQCPSVQEKTRRRSELCANRASQHGLSVEEVKWALCTVAMRSFTVLTPVQGLKRLLLPGMDLFNHAAGAPHNFRVRWTPQDDGTYEGLFKFVAAASMAEGEEVRIDYGRDGAAAFSNQQYLQRYGFVDESVSATVADRAWLASEDASSTREALDQTTVEEDAVLLTEGRLSPGACMAVRFRLQLKRAALSQHEQEKVLKVASAPGKPPPEVETIGNDAMQDGFFRSLWKRIRKKQ